MKNIELKVVRFESDDIMTTSCDQTVVYFETNESGRGVHYELLNFNKSIDQIESAQAAELAAVNAGLAANTSYHVTDDGKIELCSNPGSHNAASGWHLGA